MTQYIAKAALVAEVKKLHGNPFYMMAIKDVLSILDTLEVKEINSIVNPYYACIQYTDRESAIKAHAEDYSWNIESELFQQLTPEQQKMWRKEIEQACISGGYSGLNLAKDPRYKETLEVKEVDLKKEMENWIERNQDSAGFYDNVEFAKHFFELGLKAAQKGEEV